MWVGESSSVGDFVVVQPEGMACVSPTVDERIVLDNVESRLSQDVVLFGSSHSDI